MNALDIAKILHTVGMNMFNSYGNKFLKCRGKET